MWLCKVPLQRFRDSVTLIKYIFNNNNNNNNTPQNFHFRPRGPENLLVMNFFQEHQQNSRRFTVFPGGISNSRRFPVFPGVVDTLSNQTTETLHFSGLTRQWVDGRFMCNELRDRPGTGATYSNHTVLQWNGSRWHGRVSRKEKNDWVKKCMGHEVEVIRVSDRPKKISQSTKWSMCRKWNESSQWCQTRE